MAADETFALIADNRRRAADLLAGLGDDGWATPSLCAGWTVREVAAHLVVPFQVSVPRMALDVVLARFSINGAMDRTARRVAEADVDDLVSALRENADSRFTPPGLGPEGPLADTSIHLRDLARPLGRPDGPPLTTWRVALDFLVSPKARSAFVPAGRLDGLALRATDQAWSHGEGSKGSEVAGPSEALALAVSGRSVALDDLDGDGVSTLRARLGSPRRNAH